MPLVRTLLRKERGNPVRLEDQLGLSSQNPLLLAQGCHMEKGRCWGLQQGLQDSNQEIQGIRRLICSLSWKDAAPPLDKSKVLAQLSGHWGFPPSPFQCTRRKDEYLVGERLHLDSIPGHCLAWVVCSLHQHLLTQLGQPALHHTASTQAKRPSQERDPGQATLTAPRRPCPSRFRTPCIKTAKQWLQRGPTSTVTELNSTSIQGTDLKPTLAEKRPLHPPPRSSHASW